MQLPPRKKERNDVQQSKQPNSAQANTKITIQPKKEKKRNPELSQLDGAHSTNVLFFFFDRESYSLGKEELFAETALLYYRQVEVSNCKLTCPL